MPRAADPALRGSRGLPLDRNPLKRIGYTPPKIEFDVEAFRTQLQTFINDWLLPVIDDVTGIDLSSFPAFLASLHDGEGIDLPSLSGIPEAIIHALTGLTGGHLTDLETFFTNLRGSLFNGIDFLDGGFDGPTAISNFIDNLTPSGKLAQLVSGKLKPGQEPQKLLD